MNCPRCGTDNSRDSRFCKSCATPLPGTSPGLAGLPTQTIESPITEIATGTTLAGRYQVIEELGRGGMGRVYKVFDTDVKEKIALKLLRPDVALGKETLERFSNELKLARKISHRNVCRMFDLGKAEGVTFITMEFVPGEDLKKLIRKTGQLGAGRAVSIAKQVCEGLAEAHHLGVVHRDLKPQNIMVDEDGNARIMDFGIARSLEGKGLTGPGMMVGTPEYMSPEQVEGKDVDQRSDIYSLGIVLYEMLTGRVPFEGDTPFTIAVKHKSETPLDPRGLNTHIPQDLALLVLKCLEKDREARYQSAKELQSELTRIEEGLPATVGTLPKRQAARSIRITAKEGRSGRTKIALYGGAVIVLAVTVYAGLRLAAGRSEVIDSIAVLPFENTNPDPNTDYLCDGITETIINKLSQLSVFKTVINRASAFTFKGKTVDPRKVGQELEVKAVLLTRMVRQGDRLTISPTLVRARDNSQLWGERYDRKFEDIIAVEEDIASSIVQALRLKLTQQDRKKLSERPIESAAAYEFYLKANSEITRFRQDALDRALQYLKNGLDLIGDNALLYSTMAYVYWQYVNIGARQEEDIAKAEAYVDKALALDPDHPKAHTILGLIDEAFRGDQQGAVRHFKKALSASPNDHEALAWLASEYVQYAGKMSAAAPLIERLGRLDPLDVFVYGLQGMSHFYDGRYDLAVRPLRKALVLDPENPGTAWLLATALAYDNKVDEAIALVDRMAKADPENVFTKCGSILKCALLKDRERLFQQMTADFQKSCRRDAAFSQFVASVLALLDEKNQALDWLENAVNRGFINYPLLAKKDPWLQSIRGEERFKKLMERAKYEWEHFEE